jgi:hypothetical protein
MKLVALSPCEINTCLAAVISTDCNRKLDTFFFKKHFYYRIGLRAYLLHLRVVIPCSLVGTDSVFGDVQSPSAG